MEQKQLTQRDIEAVVGNHPAVRRVNFDGTTIQIALTNRDMSNAVQALLTAKNIDHPVVFGTLVRSVPVLEEPTAETAE